MVPAAGAFSPDVEYNVLLTVRKGDKRSNPRRGTTVNLKICPLEVFDILKAKVLNKACNFPNGNLISEDIYIKKGKNTSQAQFVALSQENYLSSFESRWNNITQSDVVSFGTALMEQFNFELFIYIHKGSERQQRQSAPSSSLRRATAARVAQAAISVRDF